MKPCQPPVSVYKRLLCQVISVLLVWQPVAPSIAAALTPTSGATTDASASGVPVLNIATPNGAGVSHNTFTDYNVGPQGLILNNATGQLNSTQLAGIIQNNPHLTAGHEATAIINEVTGGNRSQLQGYTEVAGKAANVMVANPYGITCSGCGFINTPQVTLTTGKPQFGADGSLVSVETTRGSITVEGQGLDAGSSDALTLISRATEVNAAIHARALNVTAGATRTDSGGSVTAIAGEGPAPVVAVDTGALGGMYASRIHLVSTENGVGVNLGNLVARQGDISLDSRGQLTVSNALASGSLTAGGGSVTLRGEHKAGGAVNVNSASDLTLDKTTLTGDGNLQLTSAGQLQSAGSTLTSGGSLSLSGHQVTTDSASQGSAAGDLHLAADTLTSQGQLTAGGNATLKAGRFTNSGQIQTGGHAAIQADSLTNSGTLQGGGVDLSGTQLINQGQLRSTGDLTVTGASLDQQGVLGSQGDTRLALSDSLNNGQNAQVLSNGNLAINAGTVTQQGTLSAAQGLTLQGGSLTTGLNSHLVSGGAMALGAGTANLSGQVSAGGNLGITGTTVTSNSDAQIQSDGDITLTAHQATLGGTRAAKGAFSASAQQLTHSGQSGAQQILLTTPGTLTNTGTLTATQLAIHSGQVSNSGLLQGSGGMDIQTGQLDNLAGGTLHSGGDVTLAIPVINNAGLITGDGALTLNNATLQNSGEVNAASLGGHTGALTNTVTGLLYASGALALNGDTLINTGQLAGDQVQLTATGRLENQGTLQGTHGVSATGDTLVNDNGAKWLSGGMLSLNAASLQNSGLLQGGQMDLTADTLQTFTGSRTLSSAAMTLNAGQLLTDGTLQGGQTHITAGHWTHSGSLLGQDGLTAGVDDTLINRGTLMSQGDMQLQATGLENQGQLLSTGNLTLQGIMPASPLSVSLLALPSAPAAMALSNLQGATLQAGGTLALTGNTLSNTGTLSGQTVQLTADTLNNTGTLSGQAVQLTTGSLVNQGNLHAGNLAVSGTDLTNSGLIQGDSSLTLSPSGTLTNTAGGTLSAGQNLTLTTASLQNDGLIQGAGYGQITAASLARNDGRILGGTALTLSTPQFSGGGWLQAGTLTLNADRATGSGTWLADQATLTGSALTSLGTIQAGTLGVNYGQITNSGTLTGTSQLTVSAGQVNQQDSGRLLSGGDLLLSSAGFDQAGQVIALGNLTLQLANAFTGRHTLAAGKTLTITSQGSLQNQGLMQGQSVNLNAGGVLTNSGQITTGNGSSSLSGAGIVTDGGSSLQGGGDVTLVSRGDIAINGFTGTLGSLVLSAPGSIVNTALLYAGNNLSLLAASIRNQRGDMLAENNLWLQRDGAGNASDEVINTSGNIETRNGDISINTGHLLNQRDGLSVSQSTQTVNTDPAMGQAVWRRLIKDMPEGSLGVTSETSGYHTGCGHNGSCIDETIIRYSYAPKQEYMAVKVANTETQTVVTANGGSATFSAGRNMRLAAGTLDNNASNILASGNMSISGNNLNNQSWLSGITTDLYVYTYQGHVATTELKNMEKSHGETQVDTPHEWYLNYALTGHDTTTENAQIYRAIIQAGGDLSASFSNNISNTSLTPNAGGTGGTLSAPALNTLSSQGIGGSVEKQAQAGTVPVNSPAWQSQLQNALQQISGGATGSSLGAIKGRGVDTSAYPLPSGSSGYFVIATNPQSPYLITVNPKLSGLGQLDPSVFGDLNALLGIKAASAPVETRSQYTDASQFLGSSYMLSRLNLNPGKDYRFLGDASFDTRYVSNAVLNQTGSRYLNGVGSDLDQMRYLMDNAASTQQKLGLQFGIALTADQVAGLDHSILWWESTTINGETVMVPKLYLSPKDATVSNGSVIAASDVQLNGGDITNTGSTLTAQNNLNATSTGSITNSNGGAINAGGSLGLTAANNINNLSAAISGKTVALDAINGDINNTTLSRQWRLDATGKQGQQISLADTQVGQTAGITATDSLGLNAGNTISLTVATLNAGGNLSLHAGNDITVGAIDQVHHFAQSGFRGIADNSTDTTALQGSRIQAGGSLSMQAGHDLTFTASSAGAGGSALLNAGNDLNLNAGQTVSNHRSGASESHQTGVDNSTLTAGQNLQLTAGRDITSQAAGLAAEGNVQLSAGRDVNLLAEAATQGDSYRSKNKTVINDQVRQQGTSLSSGGSTVITAGRDITSQAADVVAQQDIGLSAGRNVNLSTATESDYHYQEETKTKKGFLSRSTTHTISETSDTREKGSLLSGDNVSVRAGQDILVHGSSISADSDIALKATGNITTEAARNTSSDYAMQETKKSGIFGGGGLGITIGSQSSKASRKGTELTESDARSLLGTTGGNIIINAGKQVTLAATDVVAARAKGDTARQTGHIDITGSDVAIIPGQDVKEETVKQSSKSSGLSIQISNPLIDTVRNLRDIVKSGGSNVTKYHMLASEAAAGALDIGSSGGAIALPISYGRSSSSSETHTWGEYNTGSMLNAAGNIQITATGNQGAGNVDITGSRLGAGEAIIVDAKNNVAVSASTDNQHVTSSSQSSGWSITDAAPTLGSVIRNISGSPNHGSSVLPFAYERSSTQGEQVTSGQKESSLVGHDIWLTSHNGQIDISGSTLSAINDLVLAAEHGDIRVSSGENAATNTQSGSKSQIGDLGGDGFSGMTGWQKDSFSSLSESHQQSPLRSQITSQNGNVVLRADKDITLQGADLSAGKSLTLTGDNVLMMPGQDDLHTHSTSSSTQYGMKGAVSGWAVAAIQAAENAARSAEEGRDPRLTAIYAAQSGLDIASQTIQSDMSPSAIKVTVTATAGTSKQTQDYHEAQQQGSTLKAGDTVIVGAKQDIQGSGVSIRGRDVVLDAGRDISLSAAQSQTQQNNQSSGSQVGVGVGFSLGGQQNGFTGEFGASTSRSKENGDTLAWQNSTVDAGDLLTVHSGRDTTLSGATLSAPKVDVNAGRDLTISSLQDKAVYDSQSSSGGVNVSVCVPPFCYGTTIQGSGSYSASTLKNNYQSVVSQSGIYAGQGGFDIHTGNHTQLDGAVIASDAPADANHLSTGTLGWRDIDNYARWSGYSGGVSLSGSSTLDPSKGGTTALPVTGGYQNADSRSSVTRSAVAVGTIDIRNPAGQTQDISTLSRDTAGASGALSNNFNAQKVQDSLEVQKEAQALGMQAINAWQQKQLADAKEKNAALSAELQAANPGMSADQLQHTLEADSRYIDPDKTYGVGSPMWTGETAAVGLLARVLGGDIQGGMAAGAAPFMAALVKQTAGNNDVARAALHGIVSAALAKAQGGNAAGASAGGIASAVMAGELAFAFYGKDAKDLTGDERSVVSNLAALMGGAVGLLAGGNGAGAISGADAARVEVENNSLGDIAQA